MKTPSPSRLTIWPGSGIALRRDIFLAAVILGLACVQPARAQLTFQRLKSFGFPALSGSFPRANLIQGSDGTLYGTTGDTGDNYGGNGTVFKLGTNGTGFIVLHTFTDTPDGAGPNAVIQGMDGALYGTTGAGGMYGGGTVFKLNTDGSGYNVLYSFGLGNSMNPRAALVQGSDGVLYLTASGGSSFKGGVYSLSTNGGSLNTIHTFTGLSGDGENPVAALVIGSDGALYGTTGGGGASGYGTVFTVNPNGGGYMVLHPFAGFSTDGEDPAAALVQGSDGALYGTTELGGSSGNGAVFKLNTDGSNFMILHSFSGSKGDGERPVAALVQGSNGNLFGTTEGNGGTGTNDEGTLFDLDTAGTNFETLYSFTQSSVPLATNADGTTPVASLIQGSDGAFYGAASEGGNSVGTVFRINGNRSGFEVLHNFSDSGGDGVNPQTTLVQGSGGTLYGATSLGGTDGIFGGGTVFKVTIIRLSGVVFAEMG